MHYTSTVGVAAGFSLGAALPHDALWSLARLLLDCCGWLFLAYVAGYAMLLAGARLSRRRAPSPRMP